MRTNTIFFIMILLMAGVLSAQYPSYTLFPGWNMIGGGSSPFSAEYFDTLDVVYPTVFTYNNSTRAYDIVDTLRPLVGYWVLANDTVVIGSDDCDCPTTVTDIDGNVYSTVLIGDQCWMAENLKATCYRDGTEVQYIADHAEWTYTTEGACCSYENNTAYAYDYGNLYNGSAVKSPHGLAPDGWHIPTDEDWKELERALGMPFTEVDSLGGRGPGIGSALANDYDLWYEGSLRDNIEFGSSGFNALPAGYRYVLGTFLSMSFNSYFWTSTSRDSSTLMVRLLGFNYSGIYRDETSIIQGFSVRCVMD